MDAPPPPRRKWQFNRWLLVLILALFGWSRWQTYTLRSALAEAEALGWTVQYTNPFQSIRENWKSAFKKETWLDGVTYVEIATSESFEPHASVVHRLNPKELTIKDASTMHDLSALTPLTRLQGVSLGNATRLTNGDALRNLTALKGVYLGGCKALTNVDALKNLSALQVVYLNGSKRLTNVDALKNLSALQTVSLEGCTGLTKESIAALKAALPNAQIIDP